MGKLKYLNGCVIEAASSGMYDALIHQANCECAMGSGIAPKIASRWPQVRMADNSTHKKAKEKVGKFSVALVPLDNKNLFIINLYSQYLYARIRGDKVTDYEAMEHGLSALNLYLDKGSKICLPKIGSGLGGGDWNVIEKIIENTLGDLHDVTVYSI